MIRDLSDAFTMVARETAGATLEIGEHLLLRSKIAQIAPRGDGHPVLDVTGFLTTSHYMTPMRSLIAAQGYKTYALGDGFNLGMTPKLAQHMYESVDRVTQKHGQAATLLAYSLGGAYMRVFSEEHPQMVRNVITLASPFARTADPAMIPKGLRMIVEAFNPEMARYLNDKDLAAHLARTPSVPTTSIVSKLDNFVNWRCSLNPQGALAENVEVIASHVGMPWSAQASLVVLDRLPQCKDSWKPFDATKYRGITFPRTIMPEDLPQHDPDNTNERKPRALVFKRAG
jgi:pimeloyl-ACP methyl ester carboxylesterase